MAPTTFPKVVYSISRLLSGNLGFCRLLNTAHGIQTAGIADVGQALGYHPDKEILVVAQVYVSLGVGDELRFTAAMRKQKVIISRCGRSRPVRV